ncbi:hypothetical protein ANN_26431 [Periplaneta americana]|uniref:DUF4817 domain-containing protein n=1 Tax=Periplaneta americana TaxID=6978 RepID=A0ABQ8RY87_PERAM|nr:hypothetical protein ANN_26431 [Periplaneta americana]
MFATTYVCKKLFSTIKIVKTKFRSRLTNTFVINYDWQIPTRNTILRWVASFRITGSTLKKKSPGRNSIALKLSEATIQDRIYSHSSLTVTVRSKNMFAFSNDKRAFNIASFSQRYCRPFAYVAFRFSPPASIRLSINNYYKSSTTYHHRYLPTFGPTAKTTYCGGRLIRCYTNTGGVLSLDGNGKAKGIVKSISRITREKRENPKRNSHNLDFVRYKYDSAKSGLYVV